MKLCDCPRCWRKKTDPIERFDLVAPCRLCGGLGEVEDLQLSNHFTFGEVTRSRLRSAPNDPDGPTLERMRRHLCELADKLREGLGVPISVTSGYRSPGPRGLDFAVSGPPFDSKPSAHSDGTATDLIPGAPCSPLDALEWVLGHAHPFDQAILEGGVLHLASAAPRAYGAWVQRRQALVRVESATWEAWRRDLPEGTVRLPEPPRFGYETYTGDRDQLVRVR